MKTTSCTTTIAKPNAKPKAPAHLGPSAKAVWDDLVSVCGELDRAQLTLLTAACELWERKEKLRAEIEKHGQTMVDRWGQVKPNPLLKDEATAYRGYQSYYHQLGLDIDPE